MHRDSSTDDVQVRVYEQAFVTHNDTVSYCPGDLVNTGGREGRLLGATDEMAIFLTEAGVEVAPWCIVSHGPIDDDGGYVGKQLAEGHSKLYEQIARLTEALNAAEGCRADELGETPEAEAFRRKLAARLAELCGQLWPQGREAVAHPGRQASA